MKILMLGDSITALMPTNLINAEVDNKSLFGAPIKHIAKLIDNVNLKSYDKIIILAGINDFVLPKIYTDFPAKTDKDIAAELSALVQVIKENTPAQIIVQSLYPISSDLFSQEYSSNHIKNMNNLIKDFCKILNVSYFDMHATLADKNGTLNAKYAMEDGLHPNKLGYQIICDKINTELLQEKAKQ